MLYKCWILKSADIIKISLKVVLWVASDNLRREVIVARVIKLDRVTDSSASYSGNYILHAGCSKP